MPREISHQKFRLTNADNDLIVDLIDVFFLIYSYWNVSGILRSCPNRMVGRVQLWVRSVLTR
jgi:hypothetical protein